MNNVIIKEGVSLEIENGVELIFMDEYDIQIQGKLIIGCNEINLNSNIGLASAISYTHIHNNNSGNATGRFVFGNELNGNGASARFCNVLFDGLKYGIWSADNYIGDKNVSFKNCEFVNMEYATRLNRATTVKITDSYFHDVDYVSDGGAIYDNCKFERFKWWTPGFVYYGIEVYNSELDCSHCLPGVPGYSSYCIGTAPNNAISILINNTISNASDTGLYVRGKEDIVRYNTFKSLNTAIEMRSWATTPVLEYNNFIDNDINVYGFSYDYDLGYNYWGVDTDNATAIAAKIIDLCDSEQSVTGLITWWPYYIEPIDFDHVDNLPTEYTLREDSFRCVASHAFTLPDGASTMDITYFSDTTLTLSYSPYYVVSDVFLRQDVTMTIENGVEIIFMDDFDIKVNGPFNFGCDSIGIDNDYDNRGLVPNIPINSIVRSNDAIIRQGNIEVWYNTATASMRSFNTSYRFCNVFFKDLTNAFYNNGNYDLADILIDNCEFENNEYAMFFSTGSNAQPIVRDTIIRGSIERNIFGKVAVDNVEIIGSRAETYLTDGSFTNGEITGTRGSSEACLEISAAGSIVTDNIFRNCSVGIRLRANNVKIQNNLIQLSDVAIDIDDYGAQGIHFNNLYQNTINIQADYQYDEVYSRNCSYNYYGSTDQDAIAATINDACNGAGKSLVSFRLYQSIFHQTRSIFLDGL